MTDQSERTVNRVLRTILENSNDVQGEWVSRRSVYLHCVAHANMDKDAVQQALHQLSKAEKIQVDDGEFRPADGVERPKYRGEV